MPEENQINSPKAPGSEEEPRGSFLDPDVWLVLPVAVVIDVLDVVLGIGVIVNLIVGAPLIAWMVWKTGRLQPAKERVQKLRASRKALRRGLLFFVGGSIPGVSIFFLWTLAVINTVRGK
ncbi:MAG: hypothetical protein HYS52_00905 [Candidatus Wildermuthbacteria bacterium]|nr:hypothetical protein [Candidatus Wildermuthbacteria bacterium]